MILDVDGGDILFDCDGLGAIADQRREALRAKIRDLPTETLMKTNECELASSLADKYNLAVPRLSGDTPSISSERGDVYFADETQFGGVGSTEGTVFWIASEFEGDGSLFQARPEGVPQPQCRGLVRGNSVLLRVAVDDLKGVDLKPVIGQMLDDIRSNLEQLCREKEEIRKNLELHAIEAIQERKSHQADIKRVVESLGFTAREPSEIWALLQSEFGNVKGRRLLLDETNGRSPELVQEDYSEILRVIRRMTLVMERSPAAFRRLKEEHLRDLYLVFLNGMYDGGATGETFNCNGKTDILVRDGGLNIFIAECKIWRGEKKYVDTVDQIMRYLTVRDGKAAIIVFNRNERFSEVCKKIGNASKMHPLHKSSIREDEDEFQYLFIHKDDPGREILMTVMIFNVPS